MSSESAETASSEAETALDATPAPGTGTSDPGDAEDATGPPVTDMYERVYFDILGFLDEALGTEEEDGSGGGLEADVRLLAAQRDEARAEVARLREHIEPGLFPPPAARTAHSGDSDDRDDGTVTVSRDDLRAAVAIFDRLTDSDDAHVQMTDPEVAVFDRLSAAAGTGD